MSKTDNTPVRYFAVVGNPIAHSKSPAIHHAFADAESIALRYERIEAPLDKFAETVKAFFAKPDHAGLNITVPFKEQAFALADKLTPAAQLAGAVNTLWQDEQGTLWGDTTDGAGLVRDLQVNNATTLQDKKILIVGAGGAVRGVIQPILNEKPADIVICNRTPERAEQLATLFADMGKVRASRFEDLDSDFDVIINGTSASLSGELPPLPQVVVGVQTAVYDMMYAKEATPFNRWALDLGAAQAIDGLGMLVEQAAEAFAIWHGVRPATRAVLQTLRNE